MDDQVEIILDADNSVTVHLHGATVISWRCSGREILFVSSKAIYDNKKAIRGGIPLVFPNFGPWEFGPQHGFARISRWSVDSAPEKSENSASAVFRLVNSKATEDMWNHSFSLLYTVTITNSSLTTSLTVQNTGSSEFDFTTLLHTYIRVGDIQQTSVSGLKNLQYTDKLRNGEKFTEERELVDVVGGADRVYEKTPGSHQVMDSSTGHTVTINKSDLPDTVLWNPWVKNAAKMADFGDDEYKNMICVEAGAVSERVILNAGQSQTFSQTMSV